MVIIKLRIRSGYFTPVAQQWRLSLTLKVAAVCPLSHRSPTHGAEEVKRSTPSCSPRLPPYPFQSSSSFVSFRQFLSYGSDTIDPPGSSLRFRRAGNGIVLASGCLLIGIFIPASRLARRTAQITLTEAARWTAQLFICSGSVLLFFGCLRMSASSSACCPYLVFVSQSSFVISAELHKVAGHGWRTTGQWRNIKAPVVSSSAEWNPSS